MNKTLNIITSAIADIKGQSVIALDVHKQTAEMDFIVIATGTSKQHISSIADNVAQALKLKKMAVKSPEGEGTEWLLVDAFDVVVHVMTQSAREFYQLEKLWRIDTPSYAS